MKSKVSVASTVSALERARKVDVTVTLGLISSTPVLNCLVAIRISLKIAADMTQTEI